jgi:hypothetical protein
VADPHSANEVNWISGKVNFLCISQNFTTTYAPVQQGFIFVVASYGSMVASALAPPLIMDASRSYLLVVSLLVLDRSVINSGQSFR